MIETCDTHPHVTLVKFCPACRASVSSDKKTEAARVNGKKGGAPKGKRIPKDESVSRRGRRSVAP